MLLGLFSEKQVDVGEPLRIEHPDRTSAPPAEKERPRRKRKFGVDPDEARRFFGGEAEAVRYVPRG